MQDKLGEGYYVIEEGLPGRTTVWDDPVEGGKNGLEQLVPLILSHMPLDLLVILLGTNDFKRRFSVSAQDISWSIGRLAKTASSCSHPLLGSAPEVLVLCPPPLADLSHSPFKGLFSDGDKTSRELPSVLEKYCIENNIRFFNTCNVVESSSLDGVHWSEKEHYKLGNAVAELVSEII
jgi:lysophospholipase L1-like esterase